MKHNHLAILVAVVAVQALGFAWYTILAEPWMAGWGLDSEAVAEPKVAPFAASLIGSILGAYTISWLIGRTGLASGMAGARLGLLLGLGLLAPLLVTHSLFGGVGASAIRIDAANAVVSATLIGWILGAWRGRSAAGAEVPAREAP